MTEIAEAFVRLRPNASGFKAESESAVRSGLRDVGRIVGGAFAAAGVFEAGKSVIEAASTHQAAFAVVDQTLENAKQSTTLYGQSIEGLLEKESRLKGFHDEDLASSFIRLVSATHSSTEAFKDLQLAEDVSRARHIDVTVAALALARAEQGSTQSLSRLGIVLHGVNQNVGELKQRHDEAIAAGAKFTAQQKFIYEQALAAAAGLDKQANRTAALATVQQRFGGSAAKFAQTSSGQFQRTEQDIHQFEVAVGEHALPVINSLAEGIGKYAVELTHSQSVQDAVVTGLHDFATVGGEIKDVVQTIGPTFLEIATDAERAVSAIGAPAIVAAIGTYKVLGIATAAVATAEAFYQRALLAGMPTKAEAVAANTALAGSEAALAATSDTAAAGGIANFARGVGSLGLGAAGGPVGLAIAGVAVLAGGITFLATRESDTERATHELSSALDLLAGDLNRAKEIADGLAQSKVDVALAKDAKAAADAAAQQAAANEKATRGTSGHAAALLALRTARDQDKAAALAVGQAEDRQTQAANANVALHKKTIADRNAELSKTLGLIDSETQKNEAAARARASAAAPGFAKTEAIGRFVADASVGSAVKVASTLDEQAGKLQAKNPGLATSVRLLSQFVTAIGTLPSKAQVEFILDPSNAKKSLNVIEHDLLQGEALKQAARRGGNEVGAALGAGVAAGVKDSSPAVEAAMKGIVGKAHSAGQTAADAHSPSRRAASEIGLPIAQGIAVGINTGAPDVQRALSDTVGQAITQGGQQVRDAINSAKQNLNTIGGSLGASIGDLLTRPLQEQQQALTAAANRQTLEQLRRSAILPGGGGLAEDPAKALAELRKIGGTNAGPLEGFIGQFQQVSLAVQQDQVQARSAQVQRQIADLTDRFNRGDITGGKLNAGISAILAKNDIDIPRIARTQGIAYADAFRAELTGLRDQVQALVGAPKLPGSGLAPSIVRPIDTLKDVTQQIASAQRDRDQQQIAEQKKHTKLLTTIAGQQAAAKFIASLPKSQQAAVSAALAGTGG